MDRFPKENLSAFLNFLRAKYEAYTRAQTVFSRPYYAMIDPCDVCQLRCPTCPTGIENEGRRTGNGLETTYRTDRSKLKPELFDAVLAEIGEYLFLLELHSWGEPLLNKHATSYVRTAMALNVEVHMHTNLSLPLADERIDDLASCGLDCLFASVDGFSQEAYEKFRIGGNVDLVKENLKRLAEARSRLGVEMEIVYKFLVFRWNEHEIPAARRFAEDLGLRFLLQDACINDDSWLPSHRENEAPFLSASDIEALDRRWAAAGQRGYLREHEKHPVWLPLAADHNWVPADGSRAESFCGWHYSTTVIQPRGHVAPCCFAAKNEDRFGQIIPSEALLSEAWNGPRYRRARAAFADAVLDAPDDADSLCVRCVFPEPLRHVLSYNDGKVAKQFSHLFGNQLPTLTRAFELLSKAETAADRASFVRYFDETLRS
jgi:MoaA/NifB/PqqE/SkfB family radical SAM enzyme